MKMAPTALLLVLLIAVATEAWPKYAENTFIRSGKSLPCKARKYNYDSTVCVCNSDYCDTLVVETPKNGKQFLQYTSSREGDRLKTSYHAIGFNPRHSPDLNCFKFTVDHKTKYQKMHGFGGALTDSAGENILSLPKSAQDKLLRSYYGPEGIGYSFNRIPLGGTDFSRREYAYNVTEGDVSMRSFRLADEDYTLKIPILKRIIGMSPQEVKLLTTLWAPPSWMVELRNGTRGFTRLRSQYYEANAKYITTALDAYEKMGLKFWGLTPQNEPGDGYYTFFGFNSLGYSPEEQVRFIGRYLGPTLLNSGYGYLKLLNNDDQRFTLPQWATTVLNDSLANKYVSGTAVHWYYDFDEGVGPDRLTALHDRFTDKFILYTEACIIPDPGEPPVKLGLWNNAERYARDIIEVINHWTTGWIDWNMALNLQGGPTWAGNVLDSPIIVNASGREFYKQPMFYAMAHFAKFVPPGSYRVDMHSSNPGGIEGVAFLRPDGLVAIVFQNRNADERKAIVKNENEYMKVHLKPHSLNTVLFYPKSSSYDAPPLFRDYNHKTFVDGAAGYTHWVDDDHFDDDDDDDDDEK